MITVNGRQEDYLKAISVSGYLTSKEMRTDRVAVELNGKIIPKSMYGDTMIKDQDQLEIVSFVGGG